MESRLGKIALALIAGLIILSLIFTMVRGF
jgi:hypothetical protein